jgi:hypothetical protein
LTVPRLPLKRSHGEVRAEPFDSGVRVVDPLLNRRSVVAGLVFEVESRARYATDCEPANERCVKAARTANVCGTGRAE